MFTPGDSGPSADAFPTTADSFFRKHGSAIYEMRLHTVGGNTPHTVESLAVFHEEAWSAS